MYPNATWHVLPVTYAFLQISNHSGFFWTINLHWAGSLLSHSEDFNCTYLSRWCMSSALNIQNRSILRAIKHSSDLKFFVFFLLKMFYSQDLHLQQFIMTHVDIHQHYIQSLVHNLICIRTFNIFCIINSHMYTFAHLSFLTLFKLHG
jgi:hypothetical protein